MDSVGQEAQVFAAGRWWTMARFDLGILDEMLDWARPRIPGPLDCLKGIIGEMSPQAAAMAIRELTTDRHPVLTITDPVFMALVNTEQGKLQTLWLLLRKHQPEITREKVVDIITEVGQQAINDALEKTAGQPPAEKKSTVANASAVSDTADQPPRVVATNGAISHDRTQAKAVGNPLVNAV